MTRTAVAVVIRFVETPESGEERTVLYGPFLPHAGSAVGATIDRLYEAAVSRGSTAWAYVEDVFIGDDESDAAVVAVR